MSEAPPPPDAAPGPDASPDAARAGSSSSGEEAARTFAFAWTAAGLDSDRGVTSTLHRQLSSTAPATDRLPFLPLTAGDGGLVPLETLGEGGMGVVVAARDDLLDRTVAVKRPRPQAGGRAAGALVAEARTLAALDHPNVVPVHALGRDEAGAPVLVMKRVVGRRWSELVLDRGVDLDRDLEILLQVCDALRYAHASGVLHRDVKADNVMVGGFGEVYLMDWGCACAFDADSVTTEVVGTPAGLAPEMMTVGARIGPATDVYLLGSTLHHVLTGAPRHAGGSLREVLAAAFTSAPGRYPPSVPAELGELVDRACARDAEERFRSVGELAQAVRDFRAHRGALDLAHRASALLDPLERALAARDAGAEALFAEARFGFRGALAAWPACPEARVGLARAHALWIPARLAAGEIEAVEGLLHGLPAEEAERWAEEVATARARKAAEADALRAGDLAVAARERRLVGAGIAGTAVVLGAGVTAGTAGTVVQSGQLVVLGLVALVVVLAWVVPFWRRLTATRVSRAIIVAFVVGQFLALLQRALGWAGGATSAEMLRGEMLLYAGMYATLGITTERGLAVAAAPMVLGALAITGAPDRFMHIFPVSLIASLALAVVAFSRRERAAGRDRPAGREP